MAKVTFRNILDEHTEFIDINRDRLISACYDYAKEQNDELYDLILNHKVSLFVNNKIILPDDWVETGLEDNDEIIITPIIAGGKGGILKILIGIALIAFALGNPFGLLGVAAEGAKFAIMQSIVLGLGISLALGGVSELLFRPDLPSLPSYGGFKQTQTYNWQGIQTTAKYGAPIPVVYGTHLLGGNIISTFTESATDTDNYLYILIALCEGEIEGICREGDYTNVCLTTDDTSDDYTPPAIFINDQPLSNYTNVEWWYRTGTNSDSGATEYNPFIQGKIPYFDSIREQYTDDRELTTDGIEYTTRKDVDMVTLNLYSPALYTHKVRSDGTTRFDDKTEYYKIEYKTEGSATWYTVKGTAAKYYVPELKKHGSYEDLRNHVTLEYRDGSPRKYHQSGEYILEVHAVYYDEDALQEPLDYGKKAKNVDARILFSLYDSSGNTVLEEESLKGSYQENWELVPTKKYEWHYPPEGSPYQAWVTTNKWKPVSTQFIGASIEVGDYKLTFKASIFDVVPPGAAKLQTTEYEVTVDDSGWIPYVGNSRSGYYHTFTLDFDNLEPGNGVDTYDLKISRKSERSDDSKIQNTMILSSVIEVIQGEFIYPNTALLGLRIKATGQLSGSIPNITTMVKGTKIEVPDFTGSSVEFNDSCYNNTLGRWEDEEGNELTWDNSTYTNEYSDNAVLCVRDLMLNRRYGLGRYLTSNDIDTSGLITAIQSCHRPYRYFYDNTYDFLSWWNEASDSDWQSFVTVTQLGSQATYSKASRNVAIEGLTTTTTFSIVKLKLNTNIQQNTEYTLKVTLSDVEASTYGNITQIKVYGLGVNGINYHLSTINISGTGEGESETSFEVLASPIKEIRLMIYQSYQIHYTLSDVSLTVENNTDEKLHYHTWNGILESNQSALAALFEMCDVFRCWPLWYNGKFSFVMDEDDTPAHTISMGNMINGSFSQAFTAISSIPKTLIGQFTDEADKYNLKTLVARASESKLNPNERTIGLKGITNRTRAERELVWKLNKTINCTHVITFKTGLDYIHAVAGDIISISHTLPAWGEGGRVLDYNSTNLEIILDQEVTVSNAATDIHVIKYQTEDNNFVNATTSGMSNGTHQTVTIGVWPDGEYPKEDAVYAFGKENTVTKEFRLTSVKRQTDNIVEVSGIEHLSSLYTSEPTIKIIDDIQTDLPDVLKQPPYPNLSVVPLDSEEGLGFNITITLPNSDVYSIKETVIQFSKSGEADSYETIGVLPVGQSSMKYKDNTLSVPGTYHFRAFHRNNHTNGAVVYSSCKLLINSYVLPAPSGIRLKDQDPNDIYFEGADIHIVWNDINRSYLRAYIVEVVSTTTGKILRTETVQNPEYVYTYHDNLKDNKGTVNIGTAFTIYAQADNFTRSLGSKVKTFYNKPPAGITGLTAESVVGGVKFSWDKSQETDHKSYYIRTKVTYSGSWTDWKETTDNTLIYILNSSEITDYTDRARVYIEVVARDLYLQTSSTGSVSSDAYANRISDSIFKLVAHNSGGTGDVDELYDGDKSSGGLTF